MKLLLLLLRRRLLRQHLLFNLLLQRPAAEFEALASVLHKDSDGVRTLSLPRLALVQAAATSDLSRRLEKLEKIMTERLTAAEARAPVLEASLLECRS